MGGEGDGRRGRWEEREKKEREAVIYIAIVFNGIQRVGEVIGSKWFPRQLNTRSVAMETINCPITQSVDWSVLTGKAFYWSTSASVCVCVCVCESTA